MFERISAYIVNKRKAFMVFFILAAVFSVFSSSWVKVSNKLSDYLPESTKTKQGLDIMDENFTTFGTAKVMVNNIDYEKALELSTKLKEIAGVSRVGFYDKSDSDYENKNIEDYYKDFAALYTISFEDVEDSKLVQEAIVKVREAVSTYDNVVYTTIDKDDAKSLNEDMKVIGVLVVIIIVGVLIFTSQTYAEILIFMLTFAVAILLNVGTNFIFGRISFVTKAVGVVLQLALAIDYAIILFHRFMEERKNFKSKHALINALAKAIPEISSSSLTTMAGMVALMTMQFRIGRDLGQVLLKSIIFSMISVFLFMPALIMMFEKWIKKSMHKSFVPNIEFLGKKILSVRFIIAGIFTVLVIGGIVLSGKTAYIFDPNSIKSDKKTEYIAAKEEIERHFGSSNILAVVIPKEDYIKEARLLEEISKVEGVKSVTGLANIEVGNEGEYVLTDSLKPRELAEIADVDIDLVKLVYRFYALKNEQYGAFINSIDSYKVPIINMVDFLYEQIENGGVEIDEDITENIEDIHKSITDARKQLESEKYSRFLVVWDRELEGKATFAAIDEVEGIAKNYYNEVYVVGDSSSNYEISKSFGTDNLRISIITALLVGIILLFTFQSAALPFILVLTIQGSIWVNFSLPYLANEPMFFLSYLIVSSIQMGATIDYAIVITSRYMVLREECESKNKAISRTLNEAFPTIITSGTIMAASGFVIGFLTSNATIASLGKTLGIGVLISMILVMFVLPVLLYLFDFTIDKTSFSKKNNEEESRREDEN
ncbi:MAG: RND transporter [Lachnospiraceae bacterium]|nr:MAG: RND transporter [Lachnospiraceae bacterium]